MAFLWLRREVKFQIKSCSCLKLSFEVHPKSFVSNFWDALRNEHGLMKTFHCYLLKEI